MNDRPPQDTRQDQAANLLNAAPGLLRIAGSAWWRAAEWTVENATRGTSRVIRAAVSGESPAELFQSTGSEARAYARRLLGIGQSDGTAPVADPAAVERTAEEVHSDDLKERGEELLRRSADISTDYAEHPAYIRILDELAPDEARILRVLALSGAQPSVDVRSAGTLGLGIGSELVAPGLNMIGAEAGCRYMDRVPAYMNNLYRLGLIWFSREPVSDTIRYQVLEAQPEVAQAIASAGRGRTVRRSIHLTPFGKDFCDVCLPIHTAEIDALPAGGEA